MSKRVAQLAFRVVLACCFVTGAAYGKQGGWQTVPFYGHGEVTHLQSAPDSPNRFFLTTEHDGVYCSVDGGHHFFACVDGLGDDRYQLYQLTFASHQRVFVTTHDTAYQSVDNGQHWTRLRGFPDHSFPLVAANDQGTVMVASFNDGIHVSHDNGENWARVAKDLFPRFVMELSVSPEGDFYALSWDHLAKSTDQGLSWTTLTNPDATARIENIKVLASNTLFVVTDDNKPARHFYLSHDGGKSWQSADSGLELESFDLHRLVAINDEQLLLPVANGLYQSTDGGSHWTRYNNDSKVSYHSELTRITTNHWLASSEEVGVLESLDDGKSWQAVDMDIAIANVTGVRQTIDGGFLVSTYDGQLFKSNDKGQTWQLVYDNFHRGNVYSLTATENKLVAAVGSTVVVSEDNGASWQELPSFDQFYFLEHLFAANDHTFYAASFMAYGVMKTTDGGKHWHHLANDLPQKPVTALNGTDERHLYLSSEGKIYHSVDGGLHWQALEKLPTTIRPMVSAIATGDGQTIYAGTSAHGLFKSIDGGQHWQVVNQGLPTHDTAFGHYPMISTIHLEDNDHLFLGFTTGSASPFEAFGVYVSDDGGAHWASLNEGLGNLGVQAFSMDNQQGLLAATTGGVYRLRR